VKKSFLKILFLFLVWRVVLFVVSILAQKVFVYDPSFLYADVILARFELPQWLFSWGNFDGVHYATIVDRGYAGADLIQAFFPVFPIFVKLLNLLINNTLISGLIISNLFFLLFLFIWYLFIEKRYSKNLAYLSTLIILFFPSSFFFGAFYNESLFLTSVLLSFWFVEKKQYFLTAIFIALASATRIVGIFLIPAVLIEIIFEDYDFSKLFNSLFKKNKDEFKKLTSKLKKHLSSQKILKENSDDSLIVSFSVSSDEDVDNLIKSWLPHIEVMKPERFRKKLISELELYVKELKQISLI